MKSAYPELPLIKNPKSTSVSLEESVHYLLGLTDECNARAVYSIMVAEASRTDDKKSFRSAGEYNYAGVQTDGNRWGYSDPIVSVFRRTDSGGNYREFAGFKNNAGFFDFMANRIKDKGFDGCNADNWTETYIQKWWSPKAKASYTKGTEKYNAKKSIYNTAQKQFDEYKKTFKGRIGGANGDKKRRKILIGIGIGILVLGIVGTTAYFIWKQKN
jgi:hypothetical protein